MLKIVMAEKALFTAGALNSCNHRRVIEFVRENHTGGKEYAERRKRSFIRNIAASEQQRSVLAVEAGKFGFELSVIMRVAADVAGSARTGADFLQRFFHRLNDGIVLTHA